MDASHVRGSSLTAELPDVQVGRTTLPGLNVMANGPADQMTPSTASGIFISYRQDDAKPWAVLLRDALADAFGEAHVFLDKDALRAGNWRDQIHAALDRSGVVLVVMGQRWLTSADESGRPRLSNPEDVHRQEIAIALSRPDVTVIPVRVDHAQLPRPQDLPDDLRPLLNLQARELSDSRLRRDVDLRLLIGDIERATGLTASARKSPFGLFSSRRARMIAAAVLCLVVLVAAWLVWQSTQSTTLHSGVDVGLHPEPPSDSPTTTPRGSDTAPVVPRTSIPTAVETRNRWGERQMAEDDIDAERQVTYRSSVVVGISTITFDLPYLERLAKGGPIEGLNYLGAPFKWRFPELSIKAVNNTTGTMVLSEARLEVVSSRVIDMPPVITVEDLSVDKLVIHNEGWGQVVNPSIELCVSEPTADDSVNLFAPMSHEASVPTFADVAKVPLSRYVPERLRDATLVAVKGQIRYGPPAQRHAIAFRTRVSRQVRTAVGLPPSHFYDVTLKAGESGIVRQVSLAQEMKPGQSDHFVIRVGSDKSAEHRMNITFRTVDGKTFDGGRLSVTIFVPRSSGRILLDTSHVRSSR